MQHAEGSGLAASDCSSSAPCPSARHESANCPRTIATQPTTHALLPCPPSPLTPPRLRHGLALQHMGQLEGKWIAGALIPGLIIAILFYFDHSVSAQLAVMPQYNVKRPTAYHYDLALLGVVTIVCGILGVPPPQGSLPQAPLHTKSLATMRTTQIEARLRVGLWPSAQLHLLP